MSVALKLKSVPFGYLSGRESLNLVFLNRQTFNDKALRTEIIGLFLAQVDGFRKGLMLPLDPAAWRHLSHTLRGAASAVGAEEMAGLAEYWEATSFPATMEERGKRLDELDAIFAQLKSKLSQLH